MRNTIFSLFCFGSLFVSVFAQTPNVEEASRFRISGDLINLTDVNSPNPVSYTDLFHPVLANKSSVQLEELGSRYGWGKSSSQLDELGSRYGWGKSSSQLDELGSRYGWGKSSSQLDELGSRYGWGK